MAIDVGSAPHLGPGRTVSADVACTVLAPTVLEYQVTLARVPGLEVRESLRLTVDGAPHPVHEVDGPHGARIHRAHVSGGEAHLEYRADVTGRALPEPHDDYLHSLYLRPSRYAPVDRFFGFAGAQFPDLTTDAEKAIAVREFVAQRLDYLPGVSTPLDGAAETLLASAGVCRDYAHLTVALLRALKVPARMTAVFAPGCDPMDFHAVAEALVDGRWYVLDATALAPRATMMRIATGRDAADIAFLDNHGGSIRLDRLTVDATAEFAAPPDDPTALVAMS
ncbi:Transglutaminase domain protein OS=Tsukamurella paurometabola (strain ATCC 8368 / DSM / CCUG 35730 / CIP 100753 / JCM 10117 / KCTC 9821 / NBRC 16120 / NCIMB 702349 / NCTC 13040) OX=521096 GN=Tpau_3644 PE=4 SV=1 [Tsukamurella paurometabola]|uniref:Transglutaminase domain protein n=1 Tax=Tsukamurella paurometabola (strain ATCC 8368 / DSM 20162 / CCUG 35730 / CIP 100753 / JCM 10117 / KCTC 9821 / NBRC 16120 / NCIMB 702349 / NCTC 13040) TaxID=521096 RepID=D5UXY5_TSUPD|nr:transglutaminase family protein [Tsukamurella paurometabola]ADG80222.1 transglutaminase domain protein [Tsukamurella paurometabola DSM 20162]SUP38898.1 Transglutaminase-like superfamily [Tsukamurella paurometabola]